MRIDDYIGQMVLITLDTRATHEGLLETVEDEEIDGYVKVSNGNEVFLIPEDDIERLELARLN